MDADKKRTPFALKSKNPDFKQSIAERIKKQHYMKFVGVEITKTEEGYCEAELKVTEDHLQQNGFLHGGATALMADLVTGFAAYSLLAEGETVVTADLKISYFLPGDGELITAKGWVTKPGQMLHFCEAEIWSNREGKESLVAKATAIMAVVKNLQKK